MRRFMVLALVLVALAGAAPAVASTYSDVPSGHWASTAVGYVAVDRDWMATGMPEFRPDDDMKRREWARALVRAWAPTEAPDATTNFWDMTVEDPDFGFAAIAVKHGWMTASNGYFQPDAGTSKRVMDRALVLHLGFTDARAALDAVSSGGTALKHDSYFSTFIIAAQLRLHRNYPSGSEAPELLPTTIVSRADAAYALWRASVVPGTWVMNEVERYKTLTLPAYTASQRAAVEFAFRYVGWPYVWGGEWYRATPDGYCCGAQPQGGFDCTGWTWWTLRAAGGGYDNTKYRPYAGWPLPERSSAQMAKATKTRLTAGQVKPLDVLFFDTDSSSSDGTDWSSVDHAGLALGSGWILHSSGSRAGISLDWFGDGWWRDHFRWGRRVAS